MDITVEKAVEEAPQTETPALDQIPIAIMNAHDLEQELDWLARLINRRFQDYFGQVNLEDDLNVISKATQGSTMEEGDETFNSFPSMDNAILSPPIFLHEVSPSNYAKFIEKHQLDQDERALLALALAPYLRPQLLDVFFTRNKMFDRRFTEFGGIITNNQGDFIPTLETLVFILCGTDLIGRFRLLEKFDQAHVFKKEEYISLDSGKNESLLKAAIQMSEELRDHLTIGKVSDPEFNSEFPAQKIETQLEWDDLVLHPGTKKQIDDIHVWLKHSDTIMNEWGMAKKLRPGYRCLFYGPSGTGKTMTACLLGKSTGREVYRVDLSMVVSKYIGETEKNLAKVFDRAQRKNWILFFDEADALFGKRTETKTSNDRHANQEVSFLLQRIEVFDGIVILASNFKDNLDQAFTRRFESMVYFPMPRADERLRIWNQVIPDSLTLDESIDLKRIAKEYELSGGMVINVVRKLGMQLLNDKADRIDHQSMLSNIKSEIDK